MKANERNAVALELFKVILEKSLEPNSTLYIGGNKITNSLEMIGGAFLLADAFIKHAEATESKES